MAQGAIVVTHSNGGSDYLGFGSVVLPLTEEIKSTFGADRKAIQDKYDQLVLAEHTLTIEMGKEAERRNQAGGEPNLVFGASPTFTTYNKVLEQKFDAYKHEMFAFGRKKDCMPAYETAVSGNLLKVSAATNRMYAQTLSENNVQIRGLKKASKKAITALEECQAQQKTPEAVTKVQKEIEDIRGTLTDANEGAAAGARAVDPTGAHEF